MRKFHRHTEAEVVSMLDQARGMLAQGKSNGEIASALGISLMTYHRWRKAHSAAHPAPPLVETDRAHPMTTRDQVKRIGGLQLENSRLRSLVADLLLEKMKLEESLKRGGAKS